MKLLDSFGVNPRVVRMFLEEKGIELPVEMIDIASGENRREPYLSRNPSGQVPALELDDGSVLAETVAICEYLEERHPLPPLVGTTPEERAETRMATRRVEFNVTEFMYTGFRFGEFLDFFKDRVRCVPEASQGLKLRAQDGVALMDRLLAGKRFLCGDRFTIADIVLYCCLDFAGPMGQPVDPALTNVTRWLADIAARPSAAASLSPGWQDAGVRG